MDAHGSFEQRAGGRGVAATRRATGPDVRVREQELVVAHHRQTQQRVREPRGAGRRARGGLVDLGLVLGRRESRDHLVGQTSAAIVGIAAARTRISAGEIAGGC